MSQDQWLDYGRVPSRSSHSRKRRLGRYATESAVDAAATAAAAGLAGLAIGGNRPPLHFGREGDKLGRGSLVTNPYQIPSSKGKNTDGQETAPSADIQPAVTSVQNWSRVQHNGEHDSYVLHSDRPQHRYHGASSVRTVNTTKSSSSSHSHAAKEQRHMRNKHSRPSSGPALTALAASHLQDKNPRIPRPRTRQVAATLNGDDLESYLVPGGSGGAVSEGFDPSEILEMARRRRGELAKRRLLSRGSEGGAEDRRALSRVASDRAGDNSSSRRLHRRGLSDSSDAQPSHLSSSSFGHTADLTTSSVPWWSNQSALTSIMKETVQTITQTASAPAERTKAPSSSDPYPQPYQDFAMTSVIDHLRDKHSHTGISNLSHSKRQNNGRQQGTKKYLTASRSRSHKSAASAANPSNPNSATTSIHTTPTTSPPDSPRNAPARPVSASIYRGEFSATPEEIEQMEDSADTESTMIFHKGFKRSFSAADLSFEQQGTAAVNDRPQSCPGPKKAWSLNGWEDDDEAFLYSPEEETALFVKYVHHAVTGQLPEPHEEDYLAVHTISEGEEGDEAPSEQEWDQNWTETGESKESMVGRRRRKRAPLNTSVEADAHIKLVDDDSDEDASGSWEEQEQQDSHQESTQQFHKPRLSIDGSGSVTPWNAR